MSFLILGCGSLVANQPFEIPRKIKDLSNVDGKREAHLQRSSREAKLAKVALNESGLQGGKGRWRINRRCLAQANDRLTG
jgi:hypothetical protein